MYAPFKGTVAGGLFPDAFITPPVSAAATATAANYEVNPRVLNRQHRNSEKKRKET